MFKRLFGSADRANHAIAEGIYREIVAAARQPAFYSDLGVPDTPLGRFEMLSVHMILFMHRMRGHQGAPADLAQELTDMFFQDVDHSLRELGIGDMGVPKRMKKLAKMFYGRAESYGSALEGNDAATLAEALKRNILPESDDWPGAQGLASQVLAIGADLDGQTMDDILAGKIRFGSPDEIAK